jgi:2-polyprenyl-3-methyl-5-hydroxy-6-metoxy-1,4-benzoquinol methylase
MTTYACEQPIPDYARPLHAWNPKRWYYDTARNFMRTTGQLSDGVTIGERYGYDSGVMLEYVYRNKAGGKNLLGRIIDRNFLNAPGWRGIRERGEILKHELKRELDLRGGDVRLLDVACGGGRYVLETLAAGGRVQTATLRDYRRENTESAKALAGELGVTASFEQADAFSDADLARASPKPNVVIVSGLHEIIPDNALVKQHFHQIAAIMDRPGTLIFTIQPRHPQIEFIARVLKSHTGEPWVMRLRSWEKTSKWAEAAGFKIRSISMDKQGIFGVVVADLR